MSLTALMDRFDISRSAAHRSKHRGYVFLDKKVINTDAPAEKAHEHRMKEILDWDFIVMKHLNSLPYWKVMEVRAGHSHFTEKEYIDFVSEITRIRNTINKFIVFPSAEKFTLITNTPQLQNKAFFSYGIISNSKKEINPLFDRARKECHLNQEEWNEMKEIAKLRYNALNIGAIQDNKD